MNAADKRFTDHGRHEIAELKKELARVLAHLKVIEWKEDNWNVWRCPSCEERQQSGHASYCQHDKTIKELEGKL